MEITISLKWLLVILFTAAFVIYLLYVGREASQESGIGSGMWGAIMLLLGSFGYAIFWVIWLIIY